MLRQKLLSALLLMVCLLAVSCQKLNPEPTGDVESPQITVSEMAPLPLEYGDLKNVTAHPVNPHWAALWFQKEDKTIAIVWVNVSRGKVGQTVTIPRR